MFVFMLDTYFFNFKKIRLLLLVLVLSMTKRQFDPKDCLRAVIIFLSFNEHFISKANIYF